MTTWGQLARLDGVAQAELVACGEVEASELLDACEERIAGLEPLLRSIAALDLERARAAPLVAGPFAGVPFLIKDVTPYPGLPWRVGSRLLHGNVGVPTPYCARVDAAGLVTIGKTATSEFGLLGSTETLAHGPTLNPWDLSRSAAGSSGGAAAAVAAGLVPLAHANDGGGSIRIPAAVCGLFGFKPSRGRCVPASPGQSDFDQLTSDHCVSRSVRDSARFLLATAAMSERLPPLVIDERPPARRLRIAAWTRTGMGDEPTPAIADAHADTLALLVALGHEVEPIEAPPIDGAALGEAFFLVAGAAVAGVLAMVEAMQGNAPPRDAIEPFSRTLVERFLARGPAALEHARASFERASAAYRATTEPYDVIVTPTLATETWSLGHLSPLLPAETLLARTARAVGYTPIHNIVGCPAMSVPLHVSREGLPIGSHFAARVGDDALLLALAFELEAARPWRDRWPTWSHPALHP